jgi:hypothetical protein
MTPSEDEIAAWGERSRAACGFGPVITNEVVLARVITLALGPAPVEAEEGGDADARPT